MPDPVNLGYALDLAPAEALDYFRDRGYRVSDSWLDVWQEEHARVFTIARMAQEDLLASTRGFIDAGLADGRTTEAIERDLESHLRDAGWWGEETRTRPDGSTYTVQLGSPYRVRTIVRTNIQTAYSAGRYRRQIENIDDRPYWAYDAVLDAATRDSHRQLDGSVFRADDPIWARIYPPNGFNCRCRVRSLTERQVQARGLDVLEGEAGLGGFVPDQGWAYNPGAVDWPVQ